MSTIFNRLFGRLAEKKAEEEAKKAATLEDIYACVIRGIIDPPKTEKDIAADHALLESAIVDGLINEDRLKVLIDKATMLVNYLRDAETPCPGPDFDECQATIAKANAMIAAARRKVTDAQQTWAMVSACRENAQRLIAELPEIGEQIARAMKASWNPRVCQVTKRKLNDPVDSVANSDEPKDLQPAASVAQGTQGTLDDV